MMAETLSAGKHEKASANTWSCGAIKDDGGEGEFVSHVHVFAPSSLKKDFGANAQK